MAMFELQDFLEPPAYNEEVCPKLVRRLGMSPQAMQAAKGVEHKRWRFEGVGLKGWRYMLAMRALQTRRALAAR